MAKIIVVTNFSASSRNALEYACRFLHNQETSVLLLNIFSFPASLTGDAIAVAAMSETLLNDERKLQQEYEWVKNNYPEINIQAEMVTGVFIDELYIKAKQENASLIIMGADGRYNELLAWDANIVDAFIDLYIPVLVVPSTISYRPVQKIAFAVNYYRRNLQMPAAMIKRLIHFTKAQLYVISVVSPNEIIDEAALGYKKAVQDNLAEVSPVYFEPEFKNIFSAIDKFTAEENIDMLLVIPARHGLWHKVFQQDHTKGIVNLNHLPVLSLKQEREFI
ncbi:universal stress protein [Parafilimonas sp.]|uniref:universal stress protein n=1 Tax=Parafilimonas sp. TaxID=1969739 RepID=UPI0039E2B492